MIGFSTHSQNLLTQAFAIKHHLFDRRKLYGCTSGMIKSFKHKGLEMFFYTGTKKGIRPDHSSKLERILDRFDAANDIKDMNYPGSNLHQLIGDKKDQFSVEVSENWRVFFEFFNGDAYIVSYDDYH